MKKKRCISSKSLRWVERQYPNGDVVYSAKVGSLFVFIASSYLRGDSLWLEVRPSREGRESFFAGSLRGNNVEKAKRNILEWLVVRLNETVEYLENDVRQKQVELELFKDTLGKLKYGTGPYLMGAAE